MPKPELPLELKAEISCPVTLLIMLHPVTLIPSMKTVERDTAKRIFAEAKNNHSTPICPETKMKLTGYDTNHTIKNLIESLLNQYSINEGDRYIEDPALAALPNSVSTASGLSSSFSAQIAATTYANAASTATVLHNNPYSTPERERESVKLPCAVILTPPYFAPLNANADNNNQLKVMCVGPKQGIFWRHWNPGRSLYGMDLFIIKNSNATTRAANVEKYHIWSGVTFHLNFMRTSNVDGVNAIFLFHDETNRMTPDAVKNAIDIKLNCTSKIYSIQYNNDGFTSLSNAENITIPPPVTARSNDRKIANIAEKILTAATAQLLEWANQLRADPNAEQIGLLGNPAIAPAVESINSNPPPLRTGLSCSLM